MKSYLKFGLQLILTFSLLYNKSATSQITLDTTIYTWNLIGYDFYPVQISSSETKYYVQDTLTNAFSLYNPDFTPFLLNVNVPEPFLPFSSAMSVIYLSRSLFDCDSSNIEYAYASVGSGIHPFYIMRTDGTELFRLDSALAPWLLGTLNGSEDIRPIMNTSSGAKMFLYYPENTHNLRIYSLCGTLPTGMSHFSVINTSVEVYPNPSSGKVVFNIRLPEFLNGCELVISDSKLGEIKRVQVEPGTSIHNLDVSELSDGVFFYSVIRNGEFIRSGKFILSK